MNKKLFKFLSISILLSNIMFPTINAMECEYGSKFFAMLNKYCLGIIKCYDKDNDIKTLKNSSSKLFRDIMVAIHYYIYKKPSCEVEDLLKDEKSQNFSNCFPYIKDFVSKYKDEIKGLKNSYYNKLLEKINGDEYLETPPRSPKYKKRDTDFNLEELNIKKRNLNSKFDDLVVGQQNNPHKNPYIAISDDDEYIIKGMIC